MRPVAPMPWGAAVDTNGLKSWVMALSGELSITSSGAVAAGTLACDAAKDGAPVLATKPAPIKVAVAAASIL